MSDRWSLPGYDVEVLLGFGASGEVWRARQLSTGEAVALKRLRPGAGEAAVAALRREAAVLRSLETPYVIGLREVVGEVLVLDFAAGGSLAALLARRGHLSPGEVVTVAAPVAEALAAAHARGLVHGDVSPSNVLFTADGMPLLTDLGVAGALGEQPDRLSGTAEYVDPDVVAGRAPDAAADVWALGALCFHLLAGSPPHEGALVEDVLAGSALGARAPLGLLAPTAPRGLVAVVESALQRDPTARPGAHQLALSLHRAQPPSPVRLSGEPPPAAPLPELRETHVVPRPAVPDPEPPRRRVPRAALVGAAATAVVLAGGLAWALSGGPAGTRTVPTVVAAPATSSPPAVDVAPAAPAAVPGGRWGAVLDALDAQRSRAFAAADPALLAGVYAPGSAAARSDLAALRGLRERGQRASGVRHELRSVQVRSVSDDRVRLTVVDVLGAQQVTDAAGAVLDRRPARDAAALDVTLTRAGGAWRIAALAPRG